MINIPSAQKEWTQANQSDLFGNIWVTKNINFDTEGYMRLSYSPRAAINVSVDGDWDNPAVILYNEDYGYFVGTWDECFEVDERILFERPTQITTSGVPSGDTQSDAVWFGGLMVFTQDTDVDYYDPSGGGTWTDTNIFLTNASQSQHQAVEFLSLSAIAIADVNTVKLYATPMTATPTLITTLVISANFQITGMCYFNQNLYIATQNRYGGHAFMYVWNGLGTAANQVYEVDSNTIFSICAHMNQIVVLTGNGALLGFNGGGFDPLPNGCFPTYYYDLSLSDTTNIDMYKNIMKSNGNLLYINFNSDNNNVTKLLSQPDGIWCYDKRVGLYHRYSPTNSLVDPFTVFSGSIVAGTGVMTVSASTYPTGTEIVYDGQGNDSPPLIDNQKYFIIRLTSTTIQLAYTLEDALAGIPITFSSLGTSLHFVAYPNPDYGQFYNARTTATYVIERPVSNPMYGTDVIFGGEVFTRTAATTDTEVLITAANGIGARGYAITPKIFSENVVDTQNLVTLKFSKFMSELNKIIIKYRTYDDGLEFINTSSTAGWLGNWTSVNTFTTTGTQWADAIVGNEIEVLQGAAGGLLAHITSISEAGGTYTITLDENYDNYLTGDESVMVFRNWIKWKTIQYGDSASQMFYLSEQLGSKGKFIQMKIELRGVNTRIEDLLIDNRTRLPAKS